MSQMQTLFDTTRMFPGDWISPGGLGAIYRDWMSALYANSSIFETLGDMSLVLASAGLLAIPLVWFLFRLNRV